MGANGNRKQTLRTNIIQPYETGFLADAGHKDYNAVMGQELDRVSTATKHMFQGLDDLRSEVDQRTKALDALHLSVNDQLNRVMMEIGGVKLQLGQGITIDSITDADGNVLSGVLQGMKTDINTANGNVMVALGEITNTNTKFVGEIKKVSDKIDATVQQINGIITTQINGLTTRIAKAETDISMNNQNISSVQSLTNTINSNGTSKYQAQWGVKSTINDLQGGVGFTNDGGSVNFVIDADNFRVGRKNVTQGSYPFEVLGDGTVRMRQAIVDQIRIKQGQINNLTVSNAMITDNLYSSNWVGTNGAQGWFLNRDGSLSISGNSGDGNNRAIFDSEGLKIIRGGQEIFRAGLL